MDPWRGGGCGGGGGVWGGGLLGGAGVEYGRFGHFRVGSESKNAEIIRFNGWGGSQNPIIFYVHFFLFQKKVKKFSAAFGGRKSDFPYINFPPPPKKSDFPYINFQKNIRFKV